MTLSTDSSTPVDNLDRSVAYLRGRIEQVFDRGSQNTPRWTVTDAHELRSVLVELRRLRGRR